MLQRPSSAGAPARLPANPHLAPRLTPLARAITLATLSAGLLCLAPVSGAAAAPTVSVGPTAQEVGEADGAALFTIRLSATTGSPVTVSYRAQPGADPAATVGEDFLATKGSLTIPAGQLSASVSVPIIDDTLQEPTEHLRFVLLSAQNASLGATGARADIIDNDLPRVDLAPANLAVDEGAGSAQLNVKLSPAGTQPVTVSWLAREGGPNPATAGSDFQAVSGTLDLPAGTTAGTIRVPIIDDTLREGAEQLQVVLTGATNATLGSALSEVEIVANDSLALAQAGPYRYLDDVDPRPTPSADLRPGLLEGLGFPRVALGDSPILMSDQQLSKYQVVAVQAIGRVAGAQQLNPDLLYMRLRTPTAYQPGNNLQMPFDSTGTATGGGSVYAGHWLYSPGTALAAAIGASDTTIKVQDARKISAGSYVVVYDAPAGSFRNAEHLLVRSVNSSTNTLTVEKRGFKSTARSHASGSIIAEHVTGQGDIGVAENWMFNQSTTCPLDANSRTLGEAMAIWMANNYNRDGSSKLVDIRVDAIHFDTDRHLLDSGKGADVNNDLVRDDGFNGQGYNLWGNGLDRYYGELRQRLPGMPLVGGGSGSRGWDKLVGTQWEGFPVSNGYLAPVPEYADVDAQLANYSFHLRHHDVGPLITYGLNKTPTKLYPYQDLTGAAVPTTNAPFRFSLGLALLDNGFYGKPASEDSPDPWWDEYAVDVVPGSASFGHAIRSNPSDESRVRRHMGWMGQPLGERVRVYDATAFASDRSLITSGGFENGFTEWKGDNVSLTADGSVTLEGSTALRASPPLSFGARPADAAILGPNVYLTAGEEYTLVFGVKASAVRLVNVSVGSSTNQAFLVPTQWARRVVSFKAKSSGNHRLKFLVGREESTLWLDGVRLFRGSAGVFQRDFEHARVVVNATSQARTVELGGTFLRIKGTGQDAINDGSQVTRVTVGPHDAAILVRP